MDREFYDRDLWCQEQAEWLKQFGLSDHDTFVIVQRIWDAEERGTAAGIKLGRWAGYKDAEREIRDKIYKALG